MKKIILFELNEVPQKIVEYYCKCRPNSTLARIRNSTKKFETYTENKGHLSPWNTWPTLHRGVTNQQHYIADFNQDLTEVDKEYPPIWKILTEAGVKVGMFGSLHSYPMPKSLENYEFYVPDVFASGKECFPKNVEIFQDFNLKLSRESARNVERKIPFGDAIKLLINVPELGFKLDTIADTGAQLIKERIKPWQKVRRRTYQTILSFDVFYKLLEKTKPGFVTFFTNHVASSMHRYWGACFPNEYETVQFEDEWLDTFENEILFTMDKADKMIGRLCKFTDKNPDYLLLVTSSMGQNAFESQPTETQLYITNKDAFMKMLGLGKGSYEFMPAMYPQFNVQVEESGISKFRDHLNTFTINGNKAEYREHANGFFSVDLGHPNLTSAEISVNGQEISIDQSGLENVEIQDKSGTTAYHIPEGICFAYHPSFNENGTQTTISSAEICPMLLNNFNVKVPDYMPKTNYNLAEA
ncbi:MAG: hypothetical protein COA57_13125 [Flavobacteriales bacterium]|nr:MAG: hypothetical protein COA57_13125 [Flavobacteriales bacterium]